MMTLLARVPPLLWAALATAAVIALVQWMKPGGQRVSVVGAGALHGIRAQDAPAGVHYELDTVAHESLEDTVRRVDVAVSAWPDIVVVGYDAAALAREGTAAMQAALERTVTSVENASAVPVLVPVLAAPGDDAAAVAAARALTPWFRDQFCQRPGMQLCIDETAAGSDVAALRRALAAAMRQALRRTGFDSPTTMPAR